jgi:hypothetical protein
MWLTTLLTPAIEAARIHAPPPIELRSLGELGGLCRPLPDDPDSRICLSHRCVLWSKQSIIVLYLHEACHRLLGWAPGDDQHDCVFASFLHCLLARCDKAGVTEGAVLTLGLYELQDLPPALAAETDGGIGRSMAWSISTSNELSASGLGAEELGVEIRRRYNLWLGKLADEPLQVARARAAVAARVQAVSVLREKLFLRNLLIAALSVFVVLMLVLMSRVTAS